MNENEGPITHDNILQITEAVAELLTTHSEQIHNAIKESDDKKASIGFRVTMECTGKVPVMEVLFAFTPCKITDKRELHCDDPEQGKLPLVPAEGDLKLGKVTVHVATPEEIAARESSEVEQQNKRIALAYTNVPVPETPAVETLESRKARESFEAKALKAEKKANAKAAKKAKVNVNDMKPSDDPNKPY
jgi:hypothetical protein